MPAFPCVINFSWNDISKATFYRWEVQGEEGIILSALVNSKDLSYSEPPWIYDHVGQTLQWRGRALNQQDKLLALSEWWSFRSEK